MSRRQRRQDWRLLYKNREGTSFYTDREAILRPSRDRSAVPIAVMPSKGNSDSLMVRSVLKQNKSDYEKYEYTKAMYGIVVGSAYHAENESIILSIDDGGAKWMDSVPNRIGECLAGGVCPGNTGRPSSLHAVKRGNGGRYLYENGWRHQLKWEDSRR